MEQQGDLLNLRQSFANDKHIQKRGAQLDLYVYLNGIGENESIQNCIAKTTAKYLQMTQEE